ncbi:hypothetical protein EDEG_03479 [Edhazardia aedis USNM 41457]|uniref:Uncharacterized protein n=1 Tax=Edhazardia aedis (strain USNM 41457) TaxID=1003232 RepID=J9DL50_EDHAE|nr:hypothetical protein EDEG_03479 [Edhazardia aedis USNM 41457]|eukprot:EJW02077.1 hypothetical protein EDEG_03479 [Edhazardia aedis USNM 41457]
MIESKDSEKAMVVFKIINVVKQLILNQLLVLLSAGKNEQDEPTTKEQYKNDKLVKTSSKELSLVNKDQKFELKTTEQFSEEILESLEPNVYENTKISKTKDKSEISIKWF